MTPFNPFSALTSKIFGGIALALAIALALTMWRADALSKRLDEARQQVATEKANHAVTAASLEDLMGEMATLVEQGRERQQRTEDARKRAEREAKSLARDIERLRRADTSDPCKTPEVLFDVEI